MKITVVFVAADRQPLAGVAQIHLEVPVIPRIGEAILLPSRALPSGHEPSDRFEVVAIDHDWTREGELGGELRTILWLLRQQSS